MEGVRSTGLTRLVTMSLVTIWLLSVKRIFSVSSEQKKIVACLVPSTLTFPYNFKLLHDLPPPSPHPFPTPPPPAPLSPRHSPSEDRRTGEYLALLVSGRSRKYPGEESLSKT